MWNGGVSKYFVCRLVITGGRLRMLVKVEGLRIEAYFEGDRPRGDHT